MLILIGPSASGKTEIANMLTTKYNFQKIVTCTTRPIRQGEINGVSYHFLSPEEFQRMKENGEFVETAKYSSYYYGTRKIDIAPNRVIILEPSGLKSFKAVMKDQITSFYLDTPENIRFDRMVYRRDNIENIKQRIANDRITFNESLTQEVDYIINNVNITLEELADTIYKMYKKEKKNGKNFS